MTTWWAWALRRARASTGLLLTLLVLVIATTAILAGAVGYSGAAATTAARQALTGSVPEEAGIRVQTRMTEDPRQQDTAAQTLIQNAFTPAPVAVQRSVVSVPRPVKAGGQDLDGKLIIQASDVLTEDAEDIAGRVNLVEGSWPAPGTDTSAGQNSTDSSNQEKAGSADGDTTGATASAEGILHTATAREWDVSVGDTLSIPGAEFKIVGLWRPVDGNDPFWFGDRLAAAGKDDDSRGPMLIAPGTIATLVDAPFVRWTIQPDPARIQSGDLAHLASAAEGMEAAFQSSNASNRGVRVDGDLAPTAEAAATNLAMARALGVIPLSVLVLVTLLAVVQLARLLATTREPQVLLLVARGASRRQILTSTIAEALLVTLLGTALGALLAWGVLQLVPAGDGQTGTVLTVAGSAGAVVWVVLAVVAVLQMRRLTSGDASAVVTSGRSRTATALATVVLVLAAAGVAWWQLRRNGSPLITTDDGTLGTDLLSGAAPALLLAAAAVIAMALLGPLSRLLEAVTQLGRGAGVHLSAAQVARRLPLYAVPVVLTVLAVGATTVAGMYAGTATALRDNLAVVGQGAPLRVTLVPPPRTTGPGIVPPPPALPTERNPTSDEEPIADISGAAPVWLDGDARVGDVGLSMTMTPVAEMAPVAWSPELPGSTAPLVPSDELTQPASPEGIDIPDGTREIGVSLSADFFFTEDFLADRQEGYEAQVEGLMNPDGGLPMDEDEARATARGITDDEFELLGGTIDWSVSLLLYNPDSGQLHSVPSATIEADRPRAILKDSVAASGPEPDASAGRRADDPSEPPDYPSATLVPGGARAELAFTLPAEEEFRLLGVDLDIPSASEGFFDPTYAATREIELSATTGDGTELFGEATAGWGNRELAPPQARAEAEEEAAKFEEESGAETVELGPGEFPTFDSSPVPNLLDASGSPWQLVLDEPYRGDRGPIQIRPDTTYRPLVKPDARSGEEQLPTPDPVPVALTADAAAAANLAIGDQIQVSAFSRQLLVELAAITPAVPGTLAPQAGLMDSGAVSAYLTAAEQSLPYPNEVWIDPGSRPLAEVAEELAGRDDVDNVTATAGVPITDPTSAARLVFWVAAAGAVLLAITGIAAVAATVLTTRRSEVAVLRAIGMPPGAQARSRCGELGAVVLASALLGLGAGWLVSAAVVPELARSTTLRGQVQLPAALGLEAGPWLVLLACGVVAVAALAIGTGSRVRRQALDNTYREEIR